VELKEKLRIKGNFGVTVRSEGSRSGALGSSFFMFSLPALDHPNAEADRKAWRITVDAGE
jgi:hypothetical protein